MRARQPAMEMKLLGFIATYLDAHDGVSPSFQDCADALGVSKSQISHCLECLKKGGMLRRMSFRARAIELLVAWPPVDTAPDGAPLFSVPIRALQGRAH